MKCGYIYVTGWERFQHPDCMRSGAAMPWLKLYTDLLGNEEWLELAPSEKVLLQGVWMLTARYGNGRVRAELRWLKVQLGLRKGSLKPLEQAGFIELRASKMQAQTETDTDTEKASRVRASAPTSSDSSSHRPLSSADLLRRAQEYREGEGLP